MSIGLSTSQDSGVKMKRVHYCINPRSPPHHKVTPSILYIKKGKCFDIVLLIFLCLLFHEFLSVGTLQCFSCYNSHMQSPKT